MKNSNKSKFSLLLLLALGLSITSCKREGCTDPNASNYRSYARVDDGGCEYIGCTNPDADNYDQHALEDDGECIFARDKFIGTYYVTDECNSGNYDYSITIIPHEDFGKVLVSNMAGVLPVANVPASVFGNLLTISDTVGVNYFQGAGSLSIDELTITYSLSNGESQDNCSLFGVRQ